MTTDPRLRTLVSEGREAAEGVRDRAAVVVEAVVAPRHELPLVEAAGEELQVGELVAGRFQIQVLAQVGGMGSIYRAEDLLDGKLVAVKTLRRGVASLERFEREASRLASLHHPGIPAYVASGFTSSGLAYLAMEWLDGIDLAAYTRLRRIGVQTAVELVRRVAEAVASAHKMGLVHRDLNPGNLFLVNQNPENVRVLDFGIARLTSDSQPVTERGAKLGTPGYMAPEQVEGQDVTPETDVFALGCVLYELLTGQRAFAAPTVAEVLARIVRDTPERPSAFNAGIPPELDEVVLACMDKDPRQRPEDAEELASLLGSFQGLVDASISNQGSAPASRGSGEQQISAMIVLSDDPPGTFQRASQAASPHGLRAQRGLDGTIVLVASGPGTATDHATRAARCALAVQKATRSPRMAVTTGLAQIDGPSPSGRAFDAALVSLLVRADEDSARGSTIWLDENTATLLDSRFDVRRVDRGFVLTSLRETYEPARTVLGRKTRCVGRKRELSMLEATLTECVEEGMASAVLITGPPGIGKSRLAYEVSRKARRWPRPVEILRGGADPMSAGSPFSMLIEVVQRACQIRESEAEPARKQKLLRRLERVMPAEELPRVAEFLGELIGTRVQDQDSAQLAAARRDSVLRGDQILRAFEDWLRAECGQQAVLLVLDDFHWGDLPTVKFIDSVLRNLSEQPLMVMALARPEVHDYFPKLWSQRSVTELRVSG
ncbi:MAG TPA: protein kinase, partial [Polyangiaceae bacterium]|nr:protein kinase [Polyangiaceae bacterium]